MIVFKLLLVTAIVLNIGPGTEAINWKPFEHGNYTYQKMGKPFTCVLGKLADGDEDVFEVSQHGTGTNLTHKEVMWLGVADEGKEPAKPDTAQLHRMKIVGVKMLKIKENTKGTLISQNGTLTKKNVPGFLFENPEDLENKLEAEDKVISKKGKH